MTLDHASESAYREAEALSYDDARRVEAHWQHEHEHVRALLAQTAPRSLLDVPVGTGRFLPLYTRVPTVVGVDLSDAMLAQCEKSALGMSNVLLSRGSVTKLPFGDDTFELTLCCRLLHLLPAQLLAPAMAELARVTSGRVCVQAYVRGPLWLRARSRARRLLGRARKSEAWSHIQAYTHSDQTLRGAAESARLRLVRACEIDTYQASRVVMYLWAKP